LNRQVEDAVDGNGLHDDAEVGSVIDVGAKGSVIDVGAKGKPAPKRRKRSRKDKEVDPDAVFGDGAPLHALTRCTVPIRNSSASAVDVGESVNYLQRLNGAKLAAEAWNINGMRAKASEVMTGEFLRKSLYGVAQHADKVRLQA
jgi:hypothetical protein